MLRESAQAYLGEAGGPAHLRAVRHRQAGLDAPAWRQMGQLGWTGILLPEAVGGAALGLAPALTLAEELGRAIAPEPFVASAIIAGTLLAPSAAPAAHALARALANGDAAPTLAWQERSGQIGRPAFETRLAQGRLNGGKLHVPAWHDKAPLLVAAAGQNGPAVLLLDTHTEGLCVTPRALTDGTMGATVTFSNVPVSDDAILLSGDAAAAAIDIALASGTVGLCAQLEGLSAALWHRTLGYLQQRIQFDQPLAENQALRHQMVDLYASIELAAASWRAAAQAVEEGATSGLALHAAKARCSDVAMTMSRWAIQYHGAFGYTDEADVGLYVHAALRWSSWLGNGPAHRRRALSAHEQERGHHG